MSFAEILENKLRKEIEASVREHTRQRSSADSVTMNFQPDVISLLLGRISPVKGSMDSKAKHYHQHRPALRPQAPPKPAHKLTEAQNTAYQQFLSWGQDLADNFSNKDLKTAFRRQALKLHPDQGGSTQQFFKLQECYKLLNEIF